MKTKSKIYTYFLLQTNKRGVNLYYTAQKFNTIDKRFRENTGLICVCNSMIYNPKKKKFNFIQNLSNRLLTKEQQDNHYILIEKRYIINSGIYTSMRIKKEILLAKPIYKLYDTQEVIKIDD